LPKRALALALAAALSGCGGVAEEGTEHGADAGPVRLATDGAQGCGPLGQPFATSCYFAAGVKWLSYESARQLCASHGAQPVTIGSAEENAFVFTLLPRLNAAAWIGLRRNGPAGAFRWESGATLGYARWAAGEPNNEKGKEGCTVIWGPGLGKEALHGYWNDAPCDSPGRDTVICERPR
jgi:hypothetical protein